MDFNRAFWGRTQLKYAIGRWFCDKTAPKPWPDASDSTTNGWEKSERVNTGTIVMAIFSRLKADSAASPHLKLSFLSCSVKGQAMDP